MGEYTPLGPKPTNAQLARGIEQLHGCLDSHRDETRKSFKSVNERLSKVSAAVGADDVKGGRRTVAGLRPWSLIWRIAGATTTGFLIWQMVLKLAPWAWESFVRLNQVVAK